ncbi:MAG: hypothetical protein IKK75_04750, partial [Clostridia bacterium]|nr:hypothetical protein [Clostridia bacterium]
MDRRKFKGYLVLGCALMLFAFLLTRFDALVGFARTLWVILSPFVLGAVFAFVLNVPMRFVERRVLAFMDRKAWTKKLK